MTRPYPPPLLSSPTVGPFDLAAPDRLRVARTLGLTALPAAVADGLNHAIGCYKATEAGSRDTTKGAVLAALGELSNNGRSFEAAVARMADDRCGVDEVTLFRLQPLARAVQAGAQGARYLLRTAAQERAVELRNHPRIDPATEAFRLFCGILRLVFDGTAAPQVDRTMRNCRLFAMEVFSAAGVERDDFVAHPERLEAYLATDVSAL